MAALWELFHRKNEGVKPRPGESLEDFAAAKAEAFFTFCRSAEAAGVFA